MSEKMNEDINKFALGIKHQIFNNEVRKRRIEEGLTQRQLSMVCGLSECAIGQLETFKRYPNEKECRVISEALDCDIETLFPKWIDYFTRRPTTFVTEHLVTERMIDHPELKALPAEVDTEEIIEQVDRDLLKDKILKLLETIPDREAKVLKLRFGLEPMPSSPRGSEPTLENVAHVFGVTRERIRQIEAKALRKMKHPCRRSKLQAFL